MWRIQGVVRYLYDRQSQLRRLQKEKPENGVQKPSGTAGYGD